ncbi:response regulator transcription factor [Algibacter amylolyticus]|uniref:Response regulator transcription factor n=1 Tax=Algibacter amylolyticus TaxID=1608400 RepID=A0A5M7BAF5_9FLAO|nr:response regulator transcription factor [Algibacter amylolyticus]KAA5824514.1 response regulator transcription factor [Algibacter amylolyticus]MBB5269421.1 DNA-binding NarL/FixJ family response regulator [Algibacter amylolyticus]TSJ75287.1 response regulator transcription factor [Algibacter amylolyticus]
MIKVSITDDHYVVLKGIESLLKDEKHINVISIHENAKDTLNAFKVNEPDILFLDINLPDINGIELTKTITKTFPKVRIIALTNHEDVSFVKRILDNGAFGYLLKNAHKAELLEAISTVTKGEKFLQESIKKKILNQSLGRTENTAFQPKLTRRETEVLKAIFEELTTQEISEKLFISPKTVEAHRMNIMSKLGAKNSVGIIKIAIQKQLL